MTFSTPNNEKLSRDQFVVVHKCVDALQEELGHSNHELSKCLKDCEHVNDELCNKLTVGFQDMDTKLVELYIDNTFVKDLQQNVESIQKDLDEFQNVYTSFHEKSFAPLMGNVDANSICLNKPGKDVTNVQENVQSISQKVYKLGQTVSSIEKNMNTGCSKELMQLRRDFISLHLRVSDFIDLCQQVACFESMCHRTTDDIQEGISSHFYDNTVSKVDGLEASICNLESHMDNIETQCRQFAAQTGKMDDDVCCNACTKVVDSLTMNTKILTLCILLWFLKVC